MSPRKYSGADIADAARLREKCRTVMESTDPWTDEQLDVTEQAALASVATSLDVPLIAAAATTVALVREVRRARAEAAR